MRLAIEWAHSLSRVSSVQWWMRSFDCVSQTNAISMQIFLYFFDNFFVFNQWSLIFYNSNINTSLYQFLLKIFNFGIYTSLPFLVRSNFLYSTSNWRIIWYSLCFYSSWSHHLYFLPICDDDTQKVCCTSTCKLLYLYPII